MFAKSNCFIVALILTSTHEVHHNNIRPVFFYLLDYESAYDFWKNGIN
jgi:hypothetical protein